MTALQSQAVQDLEWAIGINRMSLQVFGTRTGSNSDSGWRTTLSRHRSLLFFGSILIVIMVPQTVALVRVWGHLLLMIENLRSNLMFIVIEFKLMILWYKNEAIVTMLESIECDWMRPKTQQERDVMLRYGKRSRYITIGGFLIIIFPLIFYYLPALFGSALRTTTNLTDTGDRLLPLQTFYPFDVYKSPVYQFVSISQAVLAVIGGCCYSTMSTLFSVFVLHVSSQLENLYNRIELMGRANDTRNFQIELKLNIMEHERLIRFFDIIEGTFSLTLLSIIAVSTLMICLLVYQTIVIFEEKIRRPLIQEFFEMSYIMYVLFTILVYSAVGDILVTHSEKIQFATYNCEWYNLKPREILMLIPMLIRSQRPLVISAGKLVDLTLPTFATLLKTAGGYVSVLLAVTD